MVTRMYKDMLAQEVNQDPYSFFGWLREHEPVRWDEQYAYWLVTRYDDIVGLARHPELFSSEYLRRDPRPVSPPIPKSDDPHYAFLKTFRSHDLLQNDPPEHGRLRDAVHPPFTPRQAEAWRALVRSIIDQLLDGVEGKGRMDLMADFATPLPLYVITEMLGIPQKDRPHVRELAHKRMNFTRLGEDRMRLAAEAIQEISDYLTPLLDQRKTHPLDDILSLISGVESRGVYTREESLANAMVLIDAGHETTINLICNGTLAFLRNPDQWELLRRDPSLAAKATEECLRYEGPVKTVKRIATQDVELRGQRIREGDRILLVLDSANRDPEAFPNPDRFDITRWPNHHIAFGSGIHYCLGQYLARLEGQEVFKALSQRFPDLRLEPQTLEYVPSLTFRNLTALWVAWK